MAASESRCRAVINALDDGVGRILDQLDRLNLTEQTIVIALPDNGAFLIPRRGLECASDARLRGGSVTVWKAPGQLSIRGGNAREYTCNGRRFRLSF